MATDEEGTVSRLREVRSAIILPTIKSADARLIKTMGDGLLAEFPSAAAAVKAAVDFQNAMVEHEADRPARNQLRFRIGINLGSMIVDGEDVLGDGVNIAARLESLAPPGGICVSRTVFEQLDDAVTAPITELGPHYVKNMPDPVEVWRIEIEGVDGETVNASAKAEKPGVAILPFDSMSPDPEFAYLADGIVEDVTTELSRFRSLFVIARNTSFTYKGTPLTPHQIADELNVRYLVEGSVRCAGRRIRLTTQLIDAPSGHTVWADRWDRTLEDLFRVQDELAHAIVSNVEPELGANERALARQKPTTDLTAWELYQRGIVEIRKPERESDQKAFDYLTAAIRADPGFAQPRALLARWYYYRIISGLADDPRAFLQKGVELAKQAIAIDDREEMGHIALGLMMAMAGHELEARALMYKAAALNPNSAVLFYGQMNIAMWQADPDTDEIVQAAQDGLRTSPKDPLVWVYHSYLAFAHLIRTMDLANPDAHHALEAACADPSTFFSVRVQAAICNLALGRTAAAQDHLNAALVLNPQLTRSGVRGMFPFPVWQKLLTLMDRELDQLVEMGLPGGE